MRHAAGAALLAASLCAAAATDTVPTVYKSSADIPVEVFFKQADYRDLHLSPDGKTLAAVVPIKGRGNLILIDIATRKGRAVTSSEHFDVFNAEWVGNKYIMYRLADGQDANGNFRYKGSYYYDIDERQIQELENSNEEKKSDIHIDTVLQTAGGDSPEAIVEMRGRSKKFPDVYTFNFKTRRSKLLTFNSPGRTIGWLVDTKGRPRIAVRSEERPARGKPQVTSYWHLPVDGDKWEKIFEESSYNDGTLYEPLGFDNDDRTLYIASNQGGRDRMAVFRYDTSEKKFGDVVAEDPVYDVSGSSQVTLLEDGNPKSRKVYGLSYQGARPSTIWFGDNPLKQMAASIKLALPETVNDVSRSEDGSVALVHAASDTDSGTYYLYNAAQKSLEPIVRDREWVNPKLMAKRTFISYKARDGMTVYGYLTLPPDSDGKNLPLIVNVHGGPQVRGYTWMSWGRWPEAQFFASRGYAVLEPEPRGSEGFGRKHFTSAWKQWGGTMQDDINDGALHLVSQGIVDRHRMGLLGGSYGGYASLEGMARDPDLWRCADASVAVSDLGLMQNVAWSDIAENADASTGGFLENEFRLWVGDSKDDAAMFDLRSPARHADNVKGPIMLTMGSNDLRVPMIHGEKMRDALLKAGKEVEYKVYPEEGHGFNKDENVFDFYRRSEAFFAKCLAK
jgi:dipeptidyl aminopeptidase/acylaminoacyl peptidase